MVEQLHIRFGFDDLRDGGEVIEILLLKLLLFHLADEDTDAIASFDQLADELDEVIDWPAFSGRSAAGVGAEGAFGRAFVSDAALGDGAHDLIETGLDDGQHIELVTNPLADVAAEIGAVGWARSEMDDCGLGRERADVIAPCIAGACDEGKDGVRVFEQLSGWLGKRGGIAKKVMPAGFDVGGIGAEGLLSELPLFAVGDVDDAGLRVKAAQGEGERPRDDEIAQGTEVEDEDVAAEHGEKIPLRL